MCATCYIFTNPFTSCVIDRYLPQQYIIRQTIKCPAYLNTTKKHEKVASILGTYINFKPFKYKQKKRTKSVLPSSLIMFTVAVCGLRVTLGKRALSMLRLPMNLSTSSMSASSMMGMKTVCSVSVEVNRSGTFCLPL